MFSQLARSTSRFSASSGPAPPPFSSLTLYSNRAAPPAAKGWTWCETMQVWLPTAISAAYQTAEVHKDAAPHPPLPSGVRRSKSIFRAGAKKTKTTEAAKLQITRVSYSVQVSGVSHAQLDLIPVSEAQGARRVCSVSEVDMLDTNVMFRSCRTQSGAATDLPSSAPGSKPAHSARLIRKRWRASTEGGHDPDDVGVCARVRAVSGVVAVDVTDTRSFIWRSIKAIRKEQIKYRRTPAISEQAKDKDGCAFRYPSEIDFYAAEGGQGPPLQISRAQSQDVHGGWILVLRPNFVHVCVLSA
ncbi:hypothetical protein B0H21DRAFT_884268 [Amylocystis lapponica]|nr:hypothetical protein B0H21DRAFT_884268 [Amylocystis lapponica]